MTFQKIIISLLIIAGICRTDVSAQDVQSDTDAKTPEKNAPIVVPKFTTPPQIDGRLDEEVWQTAARFTDFVQTQPGDNIAPSKETIAYLGYDEKNLYIGFFAYDEPDKIRATIARRDSLGSEDHVRIQLDTFNDQRRAYVLMFNPLGIQSDAIRGADDRSTDFSVDIVMESKGVILENGYSVEVKIPFKSLRYAAGEGKFWGINFKRIITRLNNETDSWMPLRRGVSDLQQLGRITGFEDIKTERTLEIVPSITVSETGERVADQNVPLTFSRLVNRPIESDIGFSVKFQITPNVTLDAAVNPDFAEVESDAPVVRANERFPIFFPEKRPFFLEGIDYFRSPLQVVNTRNIADPDAAVKLTGKTGKNTFALLGAVDRFPNTDTKAYVGILRLRRDIGENSNLGFFATQYHFGARRHNHLAGFDGKWQIDSRRQFDFQVVGTHSRRFFYDPDINRSVYRTGNGVAYRAAYDYTGRNSGFFVAANGRSRDYRADVGFTRRTNTHGADIGFRLGTEPKPENFLIGITSRSFSNINFDERGRLQNARFSLRTAFNFQNQLGMDVSGGVSTERLYEDEFGARRNAVQRGAFFGEPDRSAVQFFGEVGIEKTFNKRVSFQAEIGFQNNVFDLDFGASERYPRVSPAALAGINRLDPGKGFSFGYEMRLNLQPTDPFNIQLSYDRTKLVRDDTGLTAFDANIFSLRSTYQFTRFIFARARWDYETIDGTLNGQMLLGWNPSPGTAFYAGYNDNLSYRGFNEFNNRFDPDFRRDGRSFFIRLSYLFRKSF